MRWTEWGRVESVIFQVKVMPSQVQQELRTAFFNHGNSYSQHHICFDKRVPGVQRERYDGLEFINQKQVVDALCRGAA